MVPLALEVEPGVRAKVVAAAVVLAVRAKVVAAAVVLAAERAAEVMVASAEEVCTSCESKREPRRNRNLRSMLQPHTPHKVAYPARGTRVMRRGMLRLKD